MATKYELAMAEIECAMAVDSWMARVKQECAEADAMVAYYTRHASVEDHEHAKHDAEVR
jgi:hypothetical protein